MTTSGVNVPMDPKQRDKDIDTKLRLYGIYNAFANGKMPTNKQCDVALNSAITSKWLTSPSKDLSSEGQGLVADLRDAVEKAKLLFLSKNEGHLLQEFIWEAQKIGADDAPGVKGPVDKDTANQDASKALEGLKTLGTLLITNGEFRKLLNDAVILLRDIAGDAAAKGASRIRPSDDQLAQIDQPAEDNVWHEKPNFSKDELKARFQEEVNRYKPVSKQAGNEAVNNATEAATGGRDTVRPDQVDTGAGTSAAVDTLQKAAKESAPDEHKQKAQETKEEAQNRKNELAQRTKDFLASKMPQERRDQAVWRLKKMIVECQSHADYQQAIETLLTLAETYGGHGKHLTQQGSESVKGVRSQDHIQKAETNLRTLIERFANSTSMDDFFDSLNAIYRDADQDPQLKDWFKTVDSYIRKCLKEQGFVLQDQATEEWDHLYDEGRFLLRERYRGHTDRVLDEVKFLANQFEEDPQNRAFGDAMEKLFKDLGQDENGNPKFKPHLIKDITNVILPTIFEEVRYVPIPRIEVSDPAADVVVENIVIESDNLMPNVFELGTDNYWRWGRKKIASKNEHKVMISGSGIQADMKDISYYIKKKQGFPSITDTGVMDIFLGGEGFSFKIAASTPHTADRTHFFKADHVSVNIKNLNIKLKKSKHKVLFNLFKPMLFSVVRPAITKVLEKQIRDAFEKADGFLYDVHTEARRAQDAAKQDPENASNFYNRYVDAFQSRLRQGREKAQAAAQRDTKVSLATTQHDAIFKNIKLPGGMTNKATEYKNMATQGERWESPVFSIGTAAETKDIPKLAPIQRKPHTTAESTLRDRNAASGTNSGYGNTSYGNGTNGVNKPVIDQPLPPTAPAPVI